MALASITREWTGLEGAAGCVVVCPGDDRLRLSGSGTAAAMVGAGFGVFCASATGSADGGSMAQSIVIAYKQKRSEEWVFQMWEVPQYCSTQCAREMTGWWLSRCRCDFQKFSGVGWQNSSGRWGGVRAGLTPSTALACTSTLFLSFQFALFVVPTLR